MFPSPSKARRPFKILTCRRTPSARRWAIVAMLAMMLTGNGAPFLVPGGSSVVHAQASAAVGFVLNAGDIRFIFRQIQIAQEHVAALATNPAATPFGPGPLQVNEPRLPFGLRTVDGSFNHLVAGQEKFGASDQNFPRLSPPLYRQGEAGTSYLQKRGTVQDSQPRIISNLIADQTTRNQAAIDVATAANGGILPTAEPLGTLPIFNVATDVGLSAPFNIMFTFFGQFFDHGLDLVNKGGTGTVIVPLQPDDPLFIPGSPTNFMALTRATNRPGPDGISGDNPATPQDESADDIREANNQTTPFVDQNQTYTSHPSHQVFLRHYETSTGRPLPDGRLLDSADPLTGAPAGNIGTWRDVKNQAATVLGIRLVDTDVFNIPLLVTDPYGHFVPGPLRGLPQIVLTTGARVEGNVAGGGVLVPTNARRINHGFLDDIAHNAVPSPGLAADGNNTIDPISPVNPPGSPYDDELLGAHFVTGDGRGNENIALTSVHTVFHAEHNRARDYVDSLLNTPGFLTPAEVQAWHDVHAGSGWGYGERLFQAARFITEMQYQHLVFEEFARKLVPSINPFIGDGINFRTDINPAISAEFAHQVYRLGHSMLTETISRTNPAGTTFDVPLLTAFLNPVEFNNGGPGSPRLTAAQAAGAIFQGGTRTSAMEIDEFVTEAVRNRLVGLPLDLAVLNLARGRSEGIPGLNAVRLALYLQSGDPQLLPYLDWTDFSFNMRHQESLVNYIAAYGIHPTLQSATSVAAKRTAATALLGDAAFMFAPSAISGVDRIDLWIGGLGERIAPFGSMLGTTFNYVFEHQLESLQDGDRFYYLERLDGLNFLSQLEGNSFAELIKRNTTLTGVPADVFSRPGLVLNLATILAVPGVITDDPSTPDFDEANMPDLVLLPNGTLRYTGGEHVIWNGRTGVDLIVSSEGDDTLTGDAGDDRIEGGSGNDSHVGGAGDDVLTDTFGDDVMKGGPGDDAISGGSGPFDLLQGNEGNDYILAGNDLSEIFGGPGNDIMYMGAGLSESIGGAGDDWIEGTNSPASIAIGDDNNQFQNDPNGGHDVALAGPGDMDFDMEGGDDIMVGNVVPTHRFEGMLGFDWATYRGETVFVDADMLITGAIAVNAPLNENRDRYDLLEGLSGTNFNDLLRGDNRTEADLRDDGLTGVANGHVLNAAGIARISGLAVLTGPTEFAGGNIILGGAGSDLLEGRGGNDILDGDRWLNVQLSAPNLGTPDPSDVLLYDGMRLAPSACAVRVCNATEARTLREAVFATASRVNPGSIQIVRSIVSTGALPGDIDTAVFSGPLANYAITVQGTGANRVIIVQDTVGTDGTDTIRNVERLQFTDGTVDTVGLGGVTVPNVAGLSQAAALAAIDVNFTPGTVTSQNSRTIPFGVAIGTSPLAGSLAPANSVVNLIMSLGPTIPDVHDMTVADAAIDLAVEGLVVGTISFANDAEFAANTIITQSPLPGGIIAPGGAVNLVVSLGPATVGVVPNVVGVAQESADASIVAAGFTLGAVTFTNSATIAEGSIISTNPAPGSTPPAGTAIARVVSLGTSGLVAAFAFDENSPTTAADSSVVARDGTIRQAVHVPGKFGTALSFDGVNDWVTVTDVTNSPLDLTTGMTLEAWVNPSQMSGWETVLMKERGVAGEGLLAYALYAHDGAAGTTGAGARPASYLRANPVLSTTDRRVAASTGVLPLNTWTHIASTYDGANFRFYVNGVLVGTTAGSGSINVANGALRIGGNNSSTGEFFRGLIDEVRIYNRALSAAEITADMNRPIIQP
jgi:beta-lactam-binding protein with PASTA domain